MAVIDPMYDAFFSYTTGPDARLVRRTERFLEGFHRHWLLRRLRLTPLAVCVDGSDFKLRLGDSLDSVEATLRNYVPRSRYLVVFCSAATVKSEYVALEIRIFLESHSPGAILPVVTEGGDPSADPERIFPRALIEHGCHKAIWLDFRGARTWWWRRRSLRIRPLDEERVKLAAELHGRSPDILPAWKRAAAIRRRVAVVAGVSVAALGVVAARQTTRNHALTTAQEVVQEIERGGSSSIQDLQLRAADAVARFHVLETDTAFRRAAALTFKRGVATAKGPMALSATSGRAVRVTPSGVEIGDDAPAGPWRSIATGLFTHVDISDDGTVVAALDAGGVSIWRDGALARCAGQPTGAAGRALAIDPTGARVAALFQSGQTWSMAIGRVSTCSTNPLSLWPMSTLTAPGGGRARRDDARRRPGPARLDGGRGLRSAPDRPVPRLKLGPGGRAVIAASDAGWLLATLRDDATQTLKPLNAVLEEAWRDDLPVPSAVAIVDEAFSANGQFVAVAGARTDTLSRQLGPSTLVVPLIDGGKPVAVDASRSTRELAAANAAPLLAVATDTHVRFWNWTAGREVGSVRVRDLVTALSFAAEDRLLLVGTRAEQPMLDVRDADSGTSLGRERVSEVSSIAAGGAGSRVALARFTHAPDEAAIFEMRAPRVVTRVDKAEEHVRTAALLNRAGVVFSGASRRLTIVRADERTVRHVPLDASAKQVAASRTAVFALLDDGRILRCAPGAQACDPYAAADPHVTSLAVDRSDGLFLGCDTGRIVADGQRCGDAQGAAAGARAVTLLALSDTAALELLDRRACVAATRESEACEPLSSGNERVIAGSVSGDGSLVAVAVVTAEGSRIDVFRRSWRWIPWPACRYVRQSAIVDPGEVLALEFDADGSWISAASVWNNEMVVRCFPVKAEAMTVGNCPGD